jgi:hypothetical protein
MTRDVGISSKLTGIYSKCTGMRLGKDSPRQSTESHQTYQESSWELQDTLHFFTLKFKCLNAFEELIFGYTRLFT